VNVLQTSPDNFAFIDDPLVAVVRHAPRRWLRWLADQLPKLAGIAYLIDDDMPSALRAPELPFRYAVKTAWRYARTWKLSGQLCSEIWVSAPELVSRYARFSPRLLEPNYVESKPAGEEKTVYF
jgi:hypothetical protein